MKKTVLKKDELESVIKKQNISLEETVPEDENLGDCPPATNSYYYTKVAGECIKVAY